MEKNFWQDKRVFLTGHTGFKGSWLSLWLSSLGAVVTGYSLPPVTMPNLFSLAKVGERLGQNLEGDIRDCDTLNKAMVAAKPEIVIHMAAQALVRDSYEHPLATYETNVMGTANLLEAVRQCECVRAVIIVTTDKCYENKEWYWGYREQDPLGGYDPYSSSKACAEIVTAAYRQSFLAADSVAVATVRAGNVIGGGDWAKDRLVPDCLRAIEKEEKIIIRSPEAIRPWQHVLEPLHGYLMLAERLYTEGDSWAESWNFGPGDAGVLCVGDLVEMLCRKLGGNYELHPKTDLHEAQYLKLDCSKAQMRLGWQAKLTMEKSIEYIAEWFESYRQGKDMQAVSLQQIKRYMEK